MTHDGEIDVQASTNGRQITLDPIREKVLPVTWKEVESTTPCGLRVPWVSGERGGKDFDLTAGAGVGGTYMTFSYKGRQYCTSIVDILEELFKFADEGEA